MLLILQLARVMANHRAEPLSLHGDEYDMRYARTIADHGHSP